MEGSLYLNKENQRIKPAARMSACPYSLPRLNYNSWTSKASVSAAFAAKRIVQQRWTLKNEKTQTKNIPLVGFEEAWQFYSDIRP